jgi:hypothetical protein
MEDGVEKVPRVQVTCMEGAHDSTKIMIGKLIAWNNEDVQSRYTGVVQSAMTTTSPNYHIFHLCTQFLYKVSTNSFTNP